MKTSPIKLLRDRDLFWSALRSQDLGWQELISLMGFVVFACAIYGLVMAGFRSPLLSFYVAIKLPVLFLGTTAIVAVFNWMVASLMGSGLTFRSTVFLVFASMTIGCWILLAFVPVALFFLASGVPVEGTHEELSYAHDVILMTHVCILAIAGFVGNAALLKGLRKVVTPGCPANVLFVLWIAAYAFVGCQLSWIFRPFVCNPFLPVAFMRADCLQGNFYEFIFTDLLPFLVMGAK